MCYPCPLSEIHQKIAGLRAIQKENRKSPCTKALLKFLVSLEGIFFQEYLSVDIKALKAYYPDILLLS
jgi:hypothetical protein